MLLVGSFFGRAGGIIRSAWSRPSSWSVPPQPTGGTARPCTRPRRRPRPSTPATDIDAGEIVLDLRDVADLVSLDGRTIHLSVDIGHLEVILPRGLAAQVSADVNVAGDIELFGQEHSGFGVSDDDFNGSTAGPQITIDAEVGVGQIEVHR